MLLKDKSKRGIEFFLIYIIILTLPFENTAFQASFLGVYGAPLSVFPILMLFIFKIFKNELSKSFFMISIYSVLIFIISFFIFNDFDYSIVLNQSLKNLILYLTWIFTFYFFLKTDKVSNFSISCLSILMILIIFFNLFFNDFLQAINFLNYVEIRNSKLRGFSTEGSTYGFLIICVFTLYAWVNKINIFIFISFLVFALLLVSSKGAIFSFLLSYFICCLMFFKRNLLKTVFMFLSFIFSFIYLYSVLIEQLFLDIEDYTSFSTRFTLFLLGFNSVAISPLGWGFSGYYPYFYIYGDEIISYISSFNLNFSEVKDYFVVGQTKSVSTKSFFLDSLIVYGLPFIIIYFYLIFRGLKYSLQEGDFYRALSINFILISLLFYIPGYGTYISAVALGLSLNSNFNRG